MGWVVNITPRPLYPPRKKPGTHCIGGWVDHRAGLDGCGKSRPAPTGIRSPDFPALSESLYRLSYPGAIVSEVLVNKRCIFGQVCWWKRHVPSKPFRSSSRRRHSLIWQPCVTIQSVCTVLLFYVAGLTVVFQFQYMCCYLHWVLLVCYANEHLENWIGWASRREVQVFGPRNLR